MPVEIFVQEQGKLVTVWLTRKEQEDSALRERLKSLYAGYAEKKYMVAEFHSGGEELYRNTRDLLLYNRRKRYSGKSWLSYQGIPVANGAVLSYNGSKNRAKGCGNIDRDF